jgi:hypothetical protein
MAKKREATPGAPKRVVGYVRVSTDDQTLGPAAQRGALERWCRANGAELVATFDDVGVSGAAPLDERPGLVTALDALRPLGARHSAAISSVNGRRAGHRARADPSEPGRRAPASG